MAEVREFALPDLGEGLTEAEIVRWLVEVGDVVAVDQPVVEVETAKAMVEVPCPYGGVVTARYGEEGAEVPVGAALLTVAVGADRSTDVSDATARTGSAPEPGGTSADGPAPVAEGGGQGDEETNASGNVLVGYGTGAPVARRRRVRLSEGLGPRPGAARTAPAPASGPAAAGDAPVATPGDPADPSAAGARGPMPLAFAPRPGAPSGPAASGGPAGSGRTDDGASAGGPVPVISPLVRRLARQYGVNLRHVPGSGPDGLILRADVERAAVAIREVTGPAEQAPYAAPAPPAEPAAPALGAAAATAGEERVPLRGVRGAVAEKLSRSRREIPEATCWVDADATELLAARAAMNAAGGPRVSLLALLARICAAALARHPELNSTVDTAAREIIRLPAVHLGFAAQTERGLVVPVVRDAHTRDAVSLSEEIARLTEAARAGTLTPAELTGGTFTLNNYGVFGVDGSTPIINHPEAAMLGVGRIVPKPWFHEGQLAVRQVVQLSLTFDHRVCDGGTAGGFLRYVADCVERPVLLLRDV
ncbi:dihydrolipoamide acetyltransferase family protein [Streptomyces sp. URMC 123]|uniref:dihydrolipoamide acetyltransferase family protein n=1 Tax=Streptomyces sp. URMC 123 TaxID=3423403 RepID=UPI003F1C6421